MQDATVADIATDVLRRFQAEAVASLNRLLNLSDAEALHDVRVSLRRLNSTLRAYQDYLKPHETVDSLRTRVRDIARRTNRARDVEVQIEWLSSYAEKESLGEDASCFLRDFTTSLIAEKTAEYEQVLAYLTKEKVNSWLDTELPLAFDQLHRTSSPSSSAFRSALPVLVERHVRQLEKRLGRIKAFEDVEPQHDARIAAKRLRYLIEPLKGSLPNLTKHIQTLKGLQTLLGEMNDLVLLKGLILEALPSGFDKEGLKELEIIDSERSKRFAQLEQEWLRNQPPFFSKLRTWAQNQAES